MTKTNSAWSSSQIILSDLLTKNFKKIRLKSKIKYGRLCARRVSLHECNLTEHTNLRAANKPS